jgi:ubiquinone/menaquinone biosynthesis C-methylase UbiE
MVLHRARILAWLMWDSSSFFEWLATRPWYTEILTDWVAAIPAQPGDQGLEVGCGPGLLTGHLHDQGVHMTGLDRSPAMVERARRNVPDCTFTEGDALALPLEDHVVDVGFAASVVNVVTDPQKLVNELVRVVRPGGRVSVLFPTPRLSGQWAEISRQRGIVGLSAAAVATWAGKAPKREPAVIEALFEAAGLLDVRVDYFFGDTVASVTGSVRLAGQD